MDNDIDEMEKTTKELKVLKDCIENHHLFVQAKHTITQNNKRIAVLHSENYKLEEEMEKMQAPLLEVCVLNHGVKANCPEVVGRSGWCDECPQEDICPSCKKTWTD